MAYRSSADLIDAYRRRQQSRFTFTFADISKGLLFVFIIASPVYVSLTGRPDLPTLVELKTNTPTYTPSITPTPSATATITLTPTEMSTLTETPVPEEQCANSDPVILVVTATFQATKTALPAPTETVTPTSLPTSTLAPTETHTSTETTAPTATPVTYTVQRGDTLGGVALRYGISVEAIQALNNLATTMIYVGQVLQIPSP